MRRRLLRSETLAMEVRGGAIQSHVGGRAIAPQLDCRIHTDRSRVASSSLVSEVVTGRRRVCYRRSPQRRLAWIVRRTPLERGGTGAVESSSGGRSEDRLEQVAQRRTPAITDVPRVGSVVGCQIAPRLRQRRVARLFRNLEALPRRELRQPSTPLSRRLRRAVGRGSAV